MERFEALDLPAKDMNDRKLGHNLYVFKPTDDICSEELFERL